MGGPPVAHQLNSARFPNQRLARSRAAENIQRHTVNHLLCYSAKGPLLVQGLEYRKRDTTGKVPFLPQSRNPKTFRLPEIEPCAAVNLASRLPHPTWRGPATLAP